VIRLAILSFAVLAAPIWTPDYTVCTPVPTGPIVSQKPVQPFVRKPDEAAVHFAYGSEIDDSYPPVRFRGDGSAWVHFVNPAKIAETCGEKPDPNLEACQQGNVIVLPNPSTVPAEAFRRLAAHELGHRLGWAGNHPR
jgi:hypothetical protein